MEKLICYDWNFYIVNKKTKKIVMGFVDKKDAFTCAKEDKKYLVVEKSKLTCEASVLDNWSRLYPKHWL